MTKDDMILVSVDDHVIEPPDMFDAFIPAKYADEAPRFVSDDISDKWIFGEGEARNVALNAVAGRPPEEYGLEPTRRDHIVTCFITDGFGVRNLDGMQEDMVAWECDYPHSDSTWPRSPETVFESVEGLTDEQIDKITHRNAMRLFSYDPFSIRPREECTVGALRRSAEGHDISIVARGKKEHTITTLGQFVDSVKG
jgi:hypothetical protein